MQKIILVKRFLPPTGGFGMTLCVSWFLVFCGWLFTPGLNAGGLSTNYGELRLDNLKPGGEYSTKQISNVPMTVKNTSSQKVELKIEPVTPTLDELKPGYEPIQDTSWIKLEKDNFVIEPNKEVVTDVKINIPDDKKLLGRKFQVYLWSHTLGTGGMSIAVGLKSRLLLDIALPEEARETAIEPGEISVLDVPSGKTYFFSVTNKGSKKKVYLINTELPTVAKTSDNVSYEGLPDAKWIKLSANKFSLVPGKTKQIKMNLKVPLKEEYKNKKYCAVIKVAAKQSFASSEPVLVGKCFVYLKTSK